MAFDYENPEGYAAYGRSIDRGIEKRRRDKQVKLHQARLAGIRQKYPGIKDPAARERFSKQYDIDPEAAMSDFEGSIRQAYEAQQGTQPKTSQPSLAIPKSRGSIFRGYRMRLEELKDRLAGFNAPPGLFGELAEREDRPFGLYERGSKARLAGQEQELADDLRRYLAGNFGIPFDMMRGMGWEELLKELFRRAK